MKALINLFLIISVLPGLSFSQEQISGLKYLSHNSDVILTGKVINKKSAWTGSKTKIITLVTVAAGEYLKGSSGNEITVIYPGGEIDGIGELYSHTPVFTLNEEVLLFLQKGSDNQTFSVSGGEAGKINLITEPGTDDKLTGRGIKLSALRKEILNIPGNGY